MLPSCSKTEGQAITDVLSTCAEASHAASKYDGSAAQADFITKSFQGIDVTACPQDFRVAYQAHVNAWSVYADSFPSKTGAPLANNVGQQVNSTYYALTMVAAKYGAKIPRSVVGE